MEKTRSDGYVAENHSSKNNIIFSRRLPDYSKGWKWCRNCALAFKGYERCPICGRPLRSRPKRRKEKERFIEFKEIDAEVYLSE